MCWCPNWEQKESFYLDFERRKGYDRNVLTDKTNLWSKKSQLITDCFRWKQTKSKWSLIKNLDLLGVGADTRPRSPPPNTAPSHRAHFLNQTAQFVSSTLHPRHKHSRNSWMCGRARTRTSLLSSSFAIFPPLHVFKTNVDQWDKISRLISFVAT